MTIGIRFLRLVVVGLAALGTAPLVVGCAQGSPEDEAPIGPDSSGVDSDQPEVLDASTEPLADSPTVDSPPDISTDPVSEPVEQDAQDAPTSEADAAADSSSGPCVCGSPDCGPCPSVVMVSMGTGRIDSVEVTNGQYLVFLTIPHEASGQASFCQWNTSFSPTAGWPAFGKDNYPVTHIDWCDAYEYCRWAGKRLCGKPGGGAASYDGFADATASQWYAGCSGGTKLYPYGSLYSPTSCNGSDFGVGDKIATGQSSNCIGAWPGLFDMSGNVAEWEDACASSAGATDLCRIRGGSFMNNANGLTCGVDSALPRNTTDASIGFRCCAD